MRQSEAIIKALTARGEAEVTMAGASKFRKFSRKYRGLRDEQGALVPVGTVITESFWFVSRNGSLRSGPTSAKSRLVKSEVKAAIVKEGEKS